ncbi:MAG: 16S rRNA methyltransferase [Candidatus Hermodarchaeota archaeon]
MPLILILAECGVELIPKQIRNHPSVKKNLTNKLYASQLLDNSLHHSAMKQLKNFEKRGRPDIVHLCLLNALGSPLNKGGHLKLYMHTNKGKIFHYNSNIRIAKNYNRFKGLMANLLIDGEIKDFITQFKGSIRELIATFKNPEIFLFSHKGNLKKTYNELFFKDMSKNIVAIIGGFQKGTFSKNILGLSQKLTSISKEHLEAWIVTAKVINYYEILHEII